MTYNDLLREALSVWCPTYPRRCSGRMRNGRGWGQTKAYSADHIIRNINEIRGDGPGYVSVYSFPHGHTSESGENVPLIDTLMFDLDFEGAKDSSVADWKRDMSALLVRTRMVAQVLIDAGLAKHWRASLSGHKGIHLYLDFPALDDDTGTAAQFRNGLDKYTDDLVDTLQQETGLSDLDEYIDVVSGKDFARLTRLPNTVHEGATGRFGETRFCVPVSIEELAEIKTDDYVDLTRKPRKVPEQCRRNESKRTQEVLTKEIRLAKDGVLAANYSGSSFDPGKVDSYEEIANDAMDLKRLEIHMRPCSWKFRERDDMFAHGHESHIMEINCIAEMVDLKTPIDVMVEFFDVNDDFSESYTRGKIKEIIAYQYSPFTHDTLSEKAGAFVNN